MDDLITFLRAQLDDDERVARNAAPGPWQYQDIESVGGGRVCDPTVAIAQMQWDTDRVDPRIRRTVGEEEADGTGEHIARHNPARVLAEVDAKRKLLECLVGATGKGTSRLVANDEPWAIGGDHLVRLLALPYADREGYRAEWMSAGLSVVPGQSTE